MTATNHGLMGAAVAVIFRNYPAIALPLALVSHFVLDSLPHYDYGEGRVSMKSPRFRRMVTSDAIIAVLTTLFVAFAWYEIWWLVILCAFIAACPDFVWYYYYFLKPDAKTGLITQMHKFVQWSATRQGFIVETVFYILLLPTLLYFGIR
jgi:hypothetical protein